MPLSSDDQRHLTAAEGWLELGDHIAAFQEMEEIRSGARTDSEVSKLRWPIYEKAQKWGNAFTVAEGLTRIHPGDAEAFIWRSYATRHMAGGGLLQAFDLLHDAVNDFPDEPCIPHRLYLYSASLDRRVRVHGLATQALLQTQTCSRSTRLGSGGWKRRTSPPVRWRPPLRRSWCFNRVTAENLGAAI